MIKKVVLPALLISKLSLVLLSCGTTEPERFDWPRWRGPNGDGSLSLLLYRGGGQSTLVFKKKELQSYILKGWERCFQEKLESLIDSNA
ncbi:MAG: hypothetical protein JSV89_01390 [Spirochaetaceae bacterium]|nr:MAG: hypothetical protein JSV89_01390 [Spirochaetaceae bacterium]